VRLLALLLLVAGLAQPEWARRASQRTVLFVLDRSASVTEEGRRFQQDFLSAALTDSQPDQVAGVAVFGRELRLDAALAGGRSPLVVRTVVDDGATNLEGALLASAAVLPSEGSRRVILLTDGVETEGDARRAIQTLTELGIAVDVVPLEAANPADVLIESVLAPASARVGDRVPIRVRVRSTVSGTATLTLTTAEGSQDIPVRLSAGETVVEAELIAAGTGVLGVTAELRSPVDGRPENNRGQALVAVLGSPRVGVVALNPIDGRPLLDALTAAGMEATRLDDVPAQADLIGYDAIMLVNQRAPTDAAVGRLRSFVEDLGRGLVVVGGDRAYGLGSYHQSPLEALLPVSSNPDDLVRRQPLAEVLVIDTSGSMAACHCEGGPRNPLMEGTQSGVNKTDISKAGAKKAVEALDPIDRIGILAFNAGQRWALTLQPVPAPDTVDVAIAGLVPDGETEISAGLEVAFEELKAAEEDLRHLVLFTDGWGEDSRLLDLAGEIADAGITLSVVGTGEGSGEVLRRAASIGGGRFYAGRDLDSIPEIFAEETLTVARPLINEGDFLPALAAASPVTAGLTQSPPLLGYVLTKAKATARVSLEIGPADPLYATWQRGLGRVAVWTSDATSRWAQTWLGWESFPSFWATLVRDVMPPQLDQPPQLNIENGLLHVRYQTTHAPLDAVGIAQVRDPSGILHTVALRRSGEDAFTGELAVGQEGAYWVAVSVEAGGGTIASGSGAAIAGYGKEFAFGEPDPSLASELAAATGGRIAPDPASVFDLAGVRGRTPTQLWPWLALTALGLFFVDVALRRLVLAKGDVAIWKEKILPRREAVEALETAEAETPVGAPPPRREALPEEETLGRLLKRKRR